MSSDFKKFLMIAHEANMLSKMEDEKVRSYSGRCMYGRNCLGITCGSPSLVVMRLCEAAAELTDREEDDAGDPEDQVFRVSEVIRDDIREDSMGQDSIVYFPRLEWDQDEYERVYKELIGILPQDHE